MTDLRTALAIGLRSRLRQVSIWIPSASVFVFYVIDYSIRALGGNGHATASTERFSAWLVVAWLTSATGLRVLPDRGQIIPWRTGGVTRNRMRTISVGVLVGAATADGLVVGIARAVSDPAQRLSEQSASSAALQVLVVALVGAALSLQFELALAFVSRALALLATAAATALTLTAGAFSWGGAFAGWGALLFPVSDLARTAEEPFRIELAVRAILAGATYDLALVAALLALLPIRARGKA